MVPAYIPVELFLDMFHCLSYFFDLVLSRPSTYRWTHEELRLAAGSYSVTSLCHELKLSSAYAAIPVRSSNICSRSPICMKFSGLSSMAIDLALCNVLR